MPIGHRGPISVDRVITICNSIRNTNNQTGTKPDVSYIKHQSEPKKTAKNDWHNSLPPLSGLYVQPNQEGTRSAAAAKKIADGTASGVMVGR